MKKSDATDALTLTAEPESQVELSVPQLLKIAIQHGDAEKNIGVVERLIALKEREESKAAQREFAQSFHALQQEMVGVKALDEVPDREGGVRYYFASYERIMEQVRPILLKHGFSVSFDSEFKDDRMVMRCTIMHTGGHSQTTTQFMRVGKVYGANDAQNDGATATMARRYALCSALNIVITRDTDGREDDARNEGTPITFEQAETLREMVKETKSDEKAFLKFAGAAKYEEIGSKRYAELFRILNNKRQ